MNILTPDNLAFDINTISGDCDASYGVLDYSNPDDVDYFFIPLVFLDNFERPAVELQIGTRTITMPLDWSIVIVDKDLGITEAIELKNINGRSFDAWVFNPINGFAPDFDEVKVLNIYPDVEWFIPKLKNGHILVVPLESGESPKCALFLKEVSKIPHQLDVSELI